MASKHDELDIESIQLEIARITPKFAGKPVVRLGEGMDHLAVLVGEAFVFRFAKHTEAAEGLRREIALLPQLAPRLHLAIPRFEYIGECSGAGLPFVGYSLIRGEPLHRPLYDDLPVATKDGILDDLATFLNALHTFPVQEAVDRDIRSYGYRADYLEDLRRGRNDVFSLLAGTVRRDIESRLNAFLEDDANFAYAPTLLHGDLWPEHLLFSRTAGRLAGVIDFGDLSIGDSDYDLAFLTRRLGAGFLADLLRHYSHTDPARLAEKVWSFALLNAIDDALIGFERDDRSLVDSALADLTELSEADFRI